MQNTSFRSVAAQHVRRDTPAFTPITGRPNVTKRVAEPCGFTRREIRALVAEILG